MKRKKTKTTKTWLAVIVALGVSYLFGLYKQGGKAALPEIPVLQQAAPQPAASPTTSRSSDGERGMALPAPLDSRDEHILHHKGFVVSYNAEWKIPNWVAWELTASETQPKMEREDSFCEDPDFKGPQATLDDYRRSGYSRGHMVPAADMRWDEQAMAECFYLTNMCPQHNFFPSKVSF